MYLNYVMMCEAHCRKRLCGKEGKRSALRRATLLDLITQIEIEHGKVFILGEVYRHRESVDCCSCIKSQPLSATSSLMLNCLPD